MKNKDRKTEFRFFTVTQWRQEQDYLQERHSDGWRFVKVSLPGIYRFERCEPEDVVYQLDYNQDGRFAREDYLKMLSDCGWEYIQDVVGYSYVRKPVSEMTGREEIFCDDASRFDMIKRVFRGRILPLIIILLCVIIPQMVMQSHRAEPLAKTFTCIFSVLFVLYLVILISFGIQVWKYRKSLYK